MILYIIENKGYIAICKSFNDNFSWASIDSKDFYMYKLVNIELTKAQEKHLIKNNKALVWTQEYKDNILEMLK